MGYLGAWERPTDPATGLIQMGARTYDPSLGSFASEDPVLGHLGLGESVGHYLYVRDNPLNSYDLSGRDVCGTVGEAPVIGGALETGCHVATYHSPVEQTPVEDAEYLAHRAPEFIKSAKNWISHIDLNPFGNKSCEKKIIASTEPFFPCASEGGGLEEGSEPPTFVPGVDLPGGVPGFTVPVPSPVRVPVPVSPFLP